MQNMTLFPVIFIVSGLIGLNVLSYYANKNRVFPDVIWVLLLGLIYGFLSHQPTIGLPIVQLHESLVLYFFVPILIFASSQKICLSHFRKVLPAASMTASIGVLISMVLIALPLHLLLEIPLLPAFMFGAIMSATDPLAIGALLSSNKQIPESRLLLIEGESILNDGFVVTVFGALFVLMYGNETFSLTANTYHLTLSVAGALLIGVVLGRLSRWLLQFWREDYFTLRMNMTIALAFGSFLLAEHFHFSGILAVFAAALAYGYKPNHDAQNIESQRNVWEYLEYLMNAALFFLLGASVSSLAMFEGIGLAHIVIVLVVLFFSRFFALLTLWPVTLINRQHLSKKEFWIMNFSGARGAVSVALLLLLPEESAYKHLFLSLAFIMIIFTLLVYPYITQQILKKT
jgi:CPA1 family monovalent cation:H+ antiporter